MTSQSCISEAQKYQGALYKEPKKNTPKTQSQRPPHHAYVEDAEPTPPNTRPNSQAASHPVPPQAPSPPASAAEAEALNVYDYLSKSKEGVSASNMAKKRDTGFHRQDDPDTPMHDASTSRPTIVDARPSALTSKDTPAPATSDKKRKRTQPTSTVDSPRISDAAPSRHLLHTGLTGGLDRLLSAPTTSTSDSDAAAATPLAKKEREREKKRHKERHHHDEDEDRGREKEKDRKKDKASHAREAEIEDEIARLERKKARRAQRALEAGPERKKLEYPGAGTSAKNDRASTIGGGEGPANDFLRLVAQGKGSSAGSSKGQSVWGALKMWRDGGEGEGEDGEKRLWKGLRMRVNERGEVVLFAREE